MLHNANALDIALRPRRELPTRTSPRVSHILGRRTGRHPPAFERARAHGAATQPAAVVVARARPGSKQSNKNLLVPGPSFTGNAARAARGRFWLIALAAAGSSPAPRRAQARTGRQRRAPASRRRRRARTVSAVRSLVVVRRRYLASDTCLLAPFRRRRGRSQMDRGWRRARRVPRI